MGRKQGSRTSHKPQQRITRAKKLPASTEYLSFQQPRERTQIWDEKFQVPQLRDNFETTRSRAASSISLDWSKSLILHNNCIRLPAAFLRDTLLDIY